MGERPGTCAESTRASTVATSTPCSGWEGHRTSDWSRCSSDGGRSTGRRRVWPSCGGEDHGPQFAVPGALRYRTDRVAAHRQHRDAHPIPDAPRARGARGGRHLRDRAGQRHPPVQARRSRRFHRSQLPPVRRRFRSGRRGGARPGRHRPRTRRTGARPAARVSGPAGKAARDRRAGVGRRPRSQQHLARDEPSACRSSSRAPPARPSKGTTSGRCRASSPTPRSWSVRLQDFARQRHDRPLESVDVASVVGEAIDIVRTGIEGQSSLEGAPIRIQTDLPPVSSVPGLSSDLRHVVVNLLLNARDAMPRGGTIRMTAEQQENRVVLKRAGRRERHPRRRPDQDFRPLLHDQRQAGHRSRAFDGPRPARPGFIGRPGWVRSRAWIWLFSSTERTTAWAGGST